MRYDILGNLPQEHYPANVTPTARRAEDGTCRCGNGSVITTHLPCRAVCP